MTACILQSSAIFVKQWKLKIKCLWLNWTADNEDFCFLDVMMKADKTSKTIFFVRLWEGLVNKSSILKFDNFDFWTEHFLPSADQYREFATGLYLMVGSVPIYNSSTLYYFKLWSVYLNDSRPIRFLFCDFKRFDHSCK